MTKPKDTPQPSSSDPMQAWQDGMAQWSAFLTRRVQHLADTQEAMLSCKSPAELMQLQTEFMQTAVQDYAEETGAFWQRMSGGTILPWFPVAGSTKRKYDDVPL